MLQSRNFREVTVLSSKGVWANAHIGPVCIPVCFDLHIPIEPELTLHVDGSENDHYQATRKSTRQLASHAPCGVETQRNPISHTRSNGLAIAFVSLRLHRRRRLHAGICIWEFTPTAASLSVAIASTHSLPENSQISGQVLHDILNDLKHSWRYW